MGQGPFATVLDVETTGLDPLIHHILEVGAVVLGPDLKEVASFVTLSNPGPKAMEEASPEALKINGITLEELKNAPTPEQASAMLKAFVDHYPGTLHAFPNEFDRGFLSQPIWNLPNRWGECIQEAATKVMVLDRVTVELRRGKLRARLKEAAKHFGVEQVGAHRGLVDARTEALVLAEIIARRREEEILDEARLLDS